MGPHDRALHQKKLKQSTHEHNNNPDGKPPKKISDRLKDETLTEQDHATAEKLLKDLPIKAVGVLHGMFDQLDDDKSGCVNSQEFLKFFKRILKTDKLPSDFKLGTNTKITFHSFVLLMKKLGL